MNNSGSLDKGYNSYVASSASPGMATPFLTTRRGRFGFQPVRIRSGLRYFTPSKASMMAPEMAVPNTPARFGPMA
jgi:hypothetical protein